MFLEDFDGRVLSFDMKAAAVYADIFASRRRAGRPATTIDLMIASVARSHGASMVTRDTGGFEDCGITLINPWDMT
jgi:toxin FitB